MTPFRSRTSYGTTAQRTKQIESWILSKKDEWISKNVDNHRFKEQSEYNNDRINETKYYTIKRTPNQLPRFKQLVMPLITREIDMQILEKEQVMKM